jgi:hypothetical protein
MMSEGEPSRRKQIFPTDRGNGSGCKYPIRCDMSLFPLILAWDGLKCCLSFRAISMKIVSAKHTKLIHPSLPLYRHLPYKTCASFLSVMHHPPAPRLVDHARHVGSDTVVVHQTLGLPDGSDGNVLVPQVGLCASLNVLDGDGVDGTSDLLGGESLAGGDHLTTDLYEVTQRRAVIKMSRSEQNIIRSGVFYSRPRRRRWSRRDPTTD